MTRGAVRLALALGIAACGGEPRVAEPVRAAVLITLDTTRPEALSCYGAREPLTPHLDRLAAEGALYERAYTTVPLTLPAHASMFTGLVPPRHGLRDNGLRGLPDAAVTLAERARESGAQTAAFVGALVLDASFGLAQGFDVYAGPPRAEGSRSSHYPERSAREVVDAALAWLDARERDRPFLLWVHVFDPHEPYEPHAGFAPGEHAYFSEVAFADAQLGRLLDALRAEDVDEQLTVLVVGDHGEAFGEFGEFTHGALCYETTMRVPLLLAGPGVAPGTRVEHVVSVVDVMPTLLDALGLPPVPDLDGRSLLASTPEPGRGAYLESMSGYLSYGWSPLAGWVDEHGKYLHGSTPVWFAADDGVLDETVSRLEEAPVARYRDAIEARLARPPLPVDDTAPEHGALADVRQLGYVGGVHDVLEFPHPLAPSERPSPMAMTAVLRDAMRGVALANEGRLDEAVAVFETVLERNPENMFVIDRLGTALARLGRTERALELLTRVAREGPQWAGTHYNRGLCLRELGQLVEAREALARAVELAPHEPLFRDALAELGD